MAAILIDWPSVFIGCFGGCIFGIALGLILFILYLSQMFKGFK